MAQAFSFSSFRAPVTPAGGLEPGHPPPPAPPPAAEGGSIVRRQAGLVRLVGYVIRNPERRASATGLNDGKGCFVATPFAAPVNDRYPFAIL